MIASGPFDCFDFNSMAVKVFLRLSNTHRKYLNYFLISPFDYLWSKFVRKLNIILIMKLQSSEKIGSTIS